MYKRILLPLDGSELSEQALPHAVAQAERFEADLNLLRVLELMPKDRRLSEAFVKETFELTSTLAREYLDKVAAKVRKQGIPVSVATAEGRPHVEIVRFAETNMVDLIVMCSHGHSGMGRWLMGSVADRVVRGAKISVLLVQAQEPKR
jgi:nucleotide-binding universal stress UspA family protein